MERQSSQWVLVLLAALASFPRASTNGCGSFGYTCFNETHFEMCIQEASGIMLRSGELQACPMGLMCVTDSLSICSDVLTEETQGTTETEPYQTTILVDRTTLPITQNIQSTQEVFGNGEENQNIAEGVHDMNRQQQQQQLEQQQQQEEQSQQNEQEQQQQQQQLEQQQQQQQSQQNEQEQQQQLEQQQQQQKQQEEQSQQNEQEQQQQQQLEQQQQQQSPSEQMDLAQAIEPFNIQQAEIPELVQFEEADLGFVPQFPLAYHFQSGISSASGFLKQKFPHRSEPKLVHIEPSKYAASRTSFDLGNFTCPGAGLFPAPPSCTEYHICIRIGPIERHYIRSCWKGFEFSRRWRVCLPRILSDCLKNGFRSAKASSDEDSQSQESNESEESDESNESDSSESR
ncbi:uncharacterized protein [Anabrus simplex]|uniref:uncharacterized protein n=1 Tax=Anabrus simplex TaxID=316456 RepID=UPI0035A33986